jgi:hypothetical protein
LQRADIANSAGYYSYSLLAEYVKARYQYSSETKYIDSSDGGNNNIDRPTIKVKVNFTLEQAMRAQRGSTGIALLFL